MKYHERCVTYRHEATNNETCKYANTHTEKRREERRGEEERFDSIHLNVYMYMYEGAQ
jgi:hypothetical protein